MSLSRNQAARLAQETVEILAAGRYTNRAGHVVDLGPMLDAAKRGTVAYPPDTAMPTVVASANPTEYEVENETTLDAARRLVGAGFRVAALNFASARHPGGGFLNGARAQEESLCRASGLYACLDGHGMYSYHAPMRGGFYSTYVVYSPGVPVFRDAAGELLDEPYPCAFLTAPAVNVGAIDPDERDRVRPEMAERVRRVLSIAAGQGHDALVLGAWGCGVFKNDPEMIADLFREALATRFMGVFARVSFAVLDTSPDGGTIRPFEERFGAG